MKFRAILTSLVAVAMLLVGGVSAQAATNDRDATKTVTNPFGSDTATVSLYMEKPVTVDRKADGSGTFKFRLVMKSNRAISAAGPVKITIAENLATTLPKTLELYKSSTSADKKTVTFTRTFTWSKSTINKYGGNGTWDVYNVTGTAKWDTGASQFGATATSASNKSVEYFTVKS